METRFRSILLTGTVWLLLMTSWSLNAATAEEATELDILQEVEPVIQPDIKRTKFDESKIEKQSIELIPTVSIFSIEDFGANLMVSLKLQYHASEDFFVGAEYGQSESGQTSFEILQPGTVPLLSDRNYTYYMFTMGYNLLPGEAFVTDNKTFNMALYVTAGLGSVDFGGDTNVVLAFGAGYRLLISDFASIYLEMRDHTFNTDITGLQKLTHNLEFAVGIGFYF